MSAHGGERNRWRVAPGGLALAVVTSGCSALIAHSGVRSVEEISKPETRVEVRAAFGEADKVRTSPEGRTVADALSRRLKDDGCPSWERYLTVYAEEVRRRPACVDYALTSKQEAMLRQSRTLAADADAGRFPRDDALARIQWCAPLKPDRHSCVPPPSGEQATPASTLCN